MLPPLPPLPADVTSVLGRQPTVTDPSTRSESRRAGGGVRTAPARGRMLLLAAVLALALAALVVGMNVWSNASASSSESPPELPQVEEPLRTHLEDLMDRVTP